MTYLFMVPWWIWLMVGITAAMIAAKIWGARVRAAVQRFEQNRVEADRQMIADARNPQAHFRRSIEAINERVEGVRVLPDGAAIWNGERFESSDEAQDARWRNVINEARIFYQGLDEDFGLRIAGSWRNYRTRIES